MNHDINVKKMRLNCFRQSKVPGEFMLQMRVPGGMVDAKYLSYVEHIANTWGDGNFHFGTRQTFDITGIKYENIPAVNEYLEQYIKEVDAELCGVNMDTVAHEPQPWDPKAGYPTIGARNITACVGNYHCICGNCNTFELARKIEPIIFPSHYHIKINIAGCPNDCNKAHLCDFGIIGVARMTYHPERCIGCGACVRACEHGATRVLSLNEGTGKIEKDPCCCVGCGECVKACPTSAWTRQETKFYRVILGGRTGRQTPRTGKMFLNWATEDVVLGVLKNWQKFSAWVMDYKPEYLHGGHLITRSSRRSSWTGWSSTPSAWWPRISSGTRPSTAPTSTSSPWPCTTRPALRLNPPSHSYPKQQERLPHPRQPLLLVTGGR